MGLDVWWDKNIPPGKAFDDVITKALNDAKCIVVLWSKYSASSRWVKEEATEAINRDIFVPVLIEDVEIPLGFKRIEAAKLIDWNNDISDSEYIILFDAISKLLHIERHQTLVQPIHKYGKAIYKSALPYVVTIVVILAALGMWPYYKNQQSEDYKHIIETQNSATRVGDNKWEWSIYLNTDAQTLSKISCVEYILHETFPDRVKTICNPTGGFALNATGWGTFKIRVTVLFKDGTRLRLPDHQLRF